MTEAESVIFSAELLPHRSLSAFGLRNLFLFVGALAALHLLFFVVAGTWIVLLFWGVDFLLLYAAFWFNNRSAKAREFVQVTNERIEVRKLLPSGEQRSTRFNPFWARFEVERHREFGIERMVLKDKSHYAELGAFLNPDDRESFAKAMSAAVLRAQRQYWR